MPHTNKKYWHNKIQKNKMRDKANVDQMKERGWNVLVIWECQLKDSEKLLEILEGFLNETRRS